MFSYRDTNLKTIQDLKTLWKLEKPDRSSQYSGKLTAKNSCIEMDKKAILF